MISSYSKTKAFLAIFLSSTIIGLSYTFVKIGLKYSSPFDLLADRLLLAFIVLLSLNLSGLIKIEKINKTQKLKLLGVSFLYPIGFFAFQIMGINIISASESAVIYALMPIFTLIASAIILKEQTSWIQKIGILLSVLGVLYITIKSLSNTSMNYWGYLLILLSLLTMVIYFLIIKKITQEINIISITFYILIYAALMVNGTNIIKHSIQGHFYNYLQRFFTLDYIYVVLYLGLLSTLGTSFLTNFSLKYLPANVVGIFNNLSPIIGLFAGILFLNEDLHAFQIYGGVLVLIGLFMCTLKRSRSLK